MDVMQSRLFDMLIEAELLLMRRMRRQITKEEYAQGRDDAWRRIADYRTEMQAAGVDSRVPLDDLIAECRATTGRYDRSGEMGCRVSAAVGELRYQHHYDPEWITTGKPSLAEMLRHGDERIAREKASPWCPGGDTHGWEPGAMPACPRCHRTPNEMGVDMPRRHKSSKTVWNGRVPRHPKPGKEREAAEDDKARARAVWAGREVRIAITYRIDEEHPQTPSEVAEDIQETLRAAGHPSVSAEIEK